MPSTSGRAPAAIHGTLIAESLRLDAPLHGVPLTLTKVLRAGPLAVAETQPTTWTFLEFTAADADAEILAASLSEVLDPVGGWYCDFRTQAETFVVFAGHVFRYPRGDAAGRTLAAEHARRVGVPENQVDWPE
jgi:hypothetical protein